MTFLHIEFFIWMLPPVAVLFYFWQTQKSPRITPFDEAVLERLRSPEITMGLRRRNTLFFMASILLIVAMAQPVILQHERAAEREIDVLIALDLSKKSVEAFEAEKDSAIGLVRMLRGENISLVGYDTEVFRISPYTTDTEMIVSLIKGLDFDVMHRSQSDSSMIEKRRRSEEIIVIIGDPVFERNTQLSGISETIGKVKSAHRFSAHIPLFYYPLGVAMVLIWIALSSMSKRRSVPVASIVAVLFLGNLPIHAGVLDFQELNRGYMAYETGKYHQSAEHFRAYQRIHDSPEIRYNLANALYKAGDYGKALYWYRTVHTTDPLLTQRVVHNLSLCEARIHRTNHANTDNTRKERGYVSQSPIKKAKKDSGELKTRLYPM